MVREILNTRKSGGNVREFHDLVWAVAGLLSILSE